MISSHVTVPWIMELKKVKRRKVTLHGVSAYFRGPTLCHYKTYKARLQEFRRGRLLAYELIRQMPSAIRGRLTS